MTPPPAGRAGATRTQFPGRTDQNLNSGSTTRTAGAVGEFKIVTERTSFRERNFDPTMRRDPSHAPERGVGGAAFWVSYHAKGNIGVVYTVWDHDRGVHWEAMHIPSYRILSDDGARAAAWTDRFAAVNALLAEHAVEPDWKCPKNSPERKYTL